MNLFIVIPVFNSSKYIVPALQSIQPGSGNHATVLVVDNCSTDETIEKILNLRLPNVDIQVKSQKDSGPAQALNTGFKQALRSGAGIIGWLNSDDLYEPKAIQQVLKLFEQKPQLKVVYGQGRHVDQNNKVLGTYPTLPPTAKIKQFENGSFICQPTVFFRKEVFEEIGLLDEKLKTAFDFDLWLRLFKRYSKKQIGFIDANLASSRLHDDCITKRLRKLVTIESMAVISRHLGFAPIHWVRTYFDELCNSYPFIPETESLVELMQKMLAEVKPFIKPAELVKLLKLLKGDFRLRFSNNLCFVDVQPDGWVSKRLVVKLRYPQQTAPVVRLYCSGGWPKGDKRLHIKVSSSAGDVEKIILGSQDEFTLTLEAPKENSLAFVYWVIETNQTFVPQDMIKRSKDTRALSFRVNNVAIT